jgi:hypothetical protein
MPGLLNYTTTVSADKTIGEIQAMLARAGARQIMHGYDAKGNCSELSFRIVTKFGEISFLLPANIEAVEKVLTSHRVRHSWSKPGDRERATRVGWRILKDWVEAQLALIQTGMVSVEQVFLPYAQNAIGQTLYEALAEKKFTGLALPAPSNHNQTTNN